MRLVKIFNGREHETKALEDSVNQWIIDNEVEVVSITGNVAPQSPHSYATKQPAPSDILIVVTYEPANAPTAKPDLESIAF